LQLFGQFFDANAERIVNFFNVYAAALGHIRASTALAVYQFRNGSYQLTRMNAAHITHGTGYEQHLAVAHSPKKNNGALKFAFELIKQRPHAFSVDTILSTHHHAHAMDIRRGGSGVGTLP
jgi:hypothetical protein